MKFWEKQINCGIKKKNQRKSIFWDKKLQFCDGNEIRILTCKLRIPREKVRIVREKVTCFILFLFRGRSELPHNRDVSGQPWLSASLFLIGSVSLSCTLSCLLPMNYWNILWWKSSSFFLLSKRWIWMRNDTFNAQLSLER